jgi:hypothetical protein
MAPSGFLGLKRDREGDIMVSAGNLARGGRTTELIVEQGRRRLFH